jgi:S1-C subfamily serine protease
MRREALYSSSPRSHGVDRPAHTAHPDGDSAPPPAGVGESLGDRPSQAGIRRLPRAWLRFFRRHERPLLMVTGACVGLLLISLQARMRPTPRAITQQDIDAAVLHTLETKPLPSAAARAYEIIRPSVVRVRGLGHQGRDEEADTQTGVGSGVVIVDTGVILTNIHVVAGAKRVKVVFADGLESDATIIGLQPEDDLAVLQAATVPDDLTPATLRSTAELAPGDQVVAVGFPFGIGPSVSAGVVSGLRREFVSPQGKRLLTNLIQFDAAANPGSSGGPLVTTDGAVVGIVTAILNPTEQRVFVGIGFAVPIENAASAVGIHPF